uniref:MADS-box transcription factor FBP9 n=1 Tax=Solanum tuberosum TaxID=4113 RepID=M1B3E1_SOLTU
MERGARMGIEILESLRDADLEHNFTRSFIPLQNSIQLILTAILSMMTTLEKYQQCSYASLDPMLPVSDTQMNYNEYVRLKARVELLQRSQRNILGEDLGTLNSKELEQLEHQLDASLKKIRSKKLEESAARIPLGLSWGNNGGQTMEYNRLPPQTAQPFFQPLGLNSSSPQLGYNPNMGANHEVNAATTAHNINGFIPGWML